MTGYIGDLNPLTPDGTDDIADGDNVIREAKLFIKNSFPKILGEVSASQSELNKLVGFTGNVVTDAGDTITGTMVFTTGIQMDGCDISLSGGAVHGRIVASSALFNGTATFSSIPICTVTPSADDHLTRKAYVDAAVAGGADPATVDVTRFKYARAKMFYYGE